MISIHHLNTVQIETPAGATAIGHTLVLEEEGRLVLVDPGIGIADSIKPEERLGNALIEQVGFQFDTNRTAYQQMINKGLAPHLVHHCILTHLDPDHISGLSDFPRAAIHLSQEELDNFYSNNPRYILRQLGHYPTTHLYQQSGKEWFGFEARKVDVGFRTEIYLIPLPGHTTGHCGVAIKNKDKWLFYIGDAYYYRLELEDTQHPVSQLASARADNNEHRIESLRKIKTLREKHKDIEVFSFHDPSEFVF
jgi:glyoxylase-like metal-dependent hydrolase (beta-lactamase superfamily II)